MQDTSKPISSSNSRQTKAKDINSVVEQVISVSLNLREVARGAFQDSTFQTRPSMVDAESGVNSTSQSLPGRLDSIAATSSAPLLQVRELSRTGEMQAISTRHQECVDSHTSVTSPPAVTLNSAPMEKGEVPCMLSATDSGLYSEEEGSTVEEEFLEVFSDEEDDEDGLVEDGWLIPADEVSLDKVIAATGRETVYR